MNAFLRPYRATAGSHCMSTSDRCWHFWEAVVDVLCVFAFGTACRHRIANCCGKCLLVYHTGHGSRRKAAMSASVAKPAGHYYLMSSTANRGISRKVVKRGRRSDPTTSAFKCRHSRRNYYCSPIGKCGHRYGLHVWYRHERRGPVRCLPAGDNNQYLKE